MKMLLWKELREQRLVPIAMGGLVVVVTVCWYVTSLIVAAQNGNPAFRMTLGDSDLVLEFALAMCGIFAGSGLVAGEAGSGTLTFLTSMPVSRLRLWLAKFAGGLVVLAAAVFCSWAASSLIDAGLFRAEIAQNGGDFAVVAKTVDSGADVLSVTLLIFMIAFLISALVDRPLTAAVVTAITCLVLLPVLAAAVLSRLQQLQSGAGLPFGYAFYWFLVVGVTAASAAAFMSIDLQRSWRPLIVAVGLLACWGVVGGGALAAYAAYLSRQESQWLNQARPVPLLVMPPTLFANHHWTISINTPTLRRNFCTLELEPPDLDVAGAIPVSTRVIGPPVTANISVTGTHIEKQAPPGNVYRRHRSTKIVAVLNIEYTSLSHPGYQHSVIQLLDKNQDIVGRVNLFAHTFADPPNSSRQ